MALYNEVRPMTLEQMKGQETVVKTLKDAVRRGNLPNASLFVGTRGTGKTTAARIMARMVNCKNPGEENTPCGICDSCRAVMEGTSLDVIELDAASNNGVDDVRRIIELANYTPVGKKKVVILDEVHMLSTGAFNALLKILEEPPRDVLFILCTTELHKVSATIISRCRRFTFHSMEVPVIVEKLREINEKYGKTASEEALRLVAKAAKGSMRDAESIYESFLDCEGEVTLEMVRHHLGLSPEERIFAILDAVKNSDPVSAKAVLDEAQDRGESLSCLLEDLFSCIMNILAIQLGGDVTDAPENLEEYAFSFTRQRLFEILSALRRAYEQKNGNLSLSIQAAIVGLVSCESDLQELLHRVESLEEEVRMLRSHGTAAVSAPEAEAAPVMEEEMPVEDYSLPEEPVYEAASVPVPEDTTSVQGTVSAPAAESGGGISQDALAAVLAAGFVVADSATPFDSPEKPAAVPESSEKTAEKKEENKKADAGGTEEASDFFDAFARLFQ